MIRKCYVCGRTILEGEPYYNIESGIKYVCCNEECFHRHYWDALAARLNVDKDYNYVIVDQEVYEIGNDYDFPRGFDGKHWIIDFNDGTVRETNSLWDRGKLPEKLTHDFKDNATFRKD